MALKELNPKIGNYRNMEMLIVEPKTKEQLAAIKAFMKALKIDFKAEKSL